MIILLNVINYFYCRDVCNERNFGLYCWIVEVIMVWLELGIMYYELISNFVNEEVVNDKCEIWWEGEICGFFLWVWDIFEVLLD